MEEQTSIAIEMEEKEASGDESVALTEESPFRFDATPLRLYHFAHQFRSSGANNNFLKGVKWSPDGSCFLTCSDDNSLRLFYLFVSFPLFSCALANRILTSVIFAK